MPKSERQTQIPGDWWPSPKGIEFAVARGMGSGVLPDQVQRFRDYHEARGNRLKWDAAWRTWAGNFKSFGRPIATAAANRPGSLLDSVARVMGRPPARASPLGDDVPAFIDLPPGDYERVD